jgi:hypothetical protein
LDKEPLEIPCEPAKAGGMDFDDRIDSNSEIVS